MPRPHGARLVAALSEIAMQPMKAIYEDGRLVFPEGNAPKGRMEVVVVFPDPGESPPARKKDKDAGKRFVQKWSGVLKGCDISNWKDEKAEYLLKKGSQQPPESK
jgi:hypothetical protein